MSRWEFAVVQDGTAVEIADDPVDAYHIASDVNGEPRPNPYYDVPEHILEMQELNRLRKPEKPTGGAAAFKKLGLGPALMGQGPVSGHEVMELTRNFTSFDDVFDRLRDYFDHLAGNNWKTPEGMSESILGGNEKTSKEKEGINGKILGLTLVPFWRNMQAEDVRHAPQDKVLLKQVGEGVSTDIKIAKEQLGRSLDNWCVGSSWACRSTCLVGTGNNFTPGSFKVKFAKAQAFKEDPVAFCAALAWNCKEFYDRGVRNGWDAVVRLNMLSDIPWETVFPDLFAMPETRNVVYYDYTKSDVSRRNIPANYDLTLSFNGDNHVACRHALEAGHRVAVVFVAQDPARSPYSKDRNRPAGTGRIRAAEIFDFYGQDTPNPFGAKVGNIPIIIDGDESDFRAYDPAPSVVALSYKGPGGIAHELEKEIRYESGFAVVVPVQRMGDALVAAHTPYDGPLTPNDMR